MGSSGTLPYLNTVMNRFESKRERYSEFLQIFMDFNNKDYVDWNLQRLKELFDGDKSMVAEYCILLIDDMKKTKKRDGFGEAFRSVHRAMMQNNHNSHAKSSDSEQNILQGHAEMDRTVDIGEKNEKCSGNKCRKLDMLPVAERGGNSAVVPDHKIIMTESLQTEGREKNNKARSLKRKRHKRNDKEVPSIPSNARSQKRSKKEIDATSKPISQLDLSYCQSCTPSYRLNPKKLIDLHESQRTELDASVLNDSWVSVYNGKGFPKKKTNQYQDLLFKLEDDMFELDVLISSVRATTEKLERIILKMQDSTLAFKFEMEKDLSSANLRCIKQFFGQSRDIRKAGRENDLLEFQAMLKDLQQWQRDLKTRRTDFHLICRDTFSELTPKLYDRRSSV